MRNDIFPPLCCFFYKKNFSIILFHRCHKVTEKHVIFLGKEENKAYQVFHKTLMSYFFYMPFEKERPSLAKKNAWTKKRAIVHKSNLKISHIDNKSPSLHWYRLYQVRFREKKINHIHLSLIFYAPTFPQYPPFFHP